MEILFLFCFRFISADFVLFLSFIVFVLPYPFVFVSFRFIWFRLVLCVSFSIVP